MNIKELQKRLRKIGAVDKNGAAISERTLRDWAAKGLITGPEAAPRKTLKRVGRPPNKSGKGAGKIESGEPGRFYDWPEKSYEEAAAVWSIRQLSHGLEEKFKKDNEAILELRNEAERFYDDSLHPETLFFLDLVRNSLSRVWNQNNSATCLLGCSCRKSPKVIAP